MPTLHDLAADLSQEAAEPDFTYTDALTVLTTYAAQAGVPGTGEGWQCPDVHVDDTTAGELVTAYTAGLPAEGERRLAVGESW